MRQRCVKCKDVLFRISFFFQIINFKCYRPLRSVVNRCHGDADGRVNIVWLWNKVICLIKDVVISVMGNELF